MKKIINLAFLASILLWANTADAMLRPLGGSFKSLVQELGNGAKSVSYKLNYARYSQEQSFKDYGNPTTGVKHKGTSLVVTPSEPEPVDFGIRPEDQAAS